MSNSAKELPLYKIVVPFCCGSTWLACKGIKPQYVLTYYVRIKFKVITYFRTYHNSKNTQKAGGKNHLSEYLFLENVVQIQPVFSFLGMLSWWWASILWNLESGRQDLSFTNRALLGGQLKKRFPLKVPSLTPFSSSWTQMKIKC